MKASDREIMIGLLKPQPSMYELQRSLRMPYATMLRRVKKLKKDRLIVTEKARRRDGRPDKRKTVRLRLTERGLATIILKGNLSNEELKLAGGRLLPKEFSQIRFLARGLGVTSDSILKNIFDRVRPKVNLDYFNEKYFEETFLISFAETLFETYRKMTTSKKEKLNQIVMQHIKQTGRKHVSSTNELTNGILGILEEKQRKLTAMSNVLRTAIRSIEKAR